MTAHPLTHQFTTTQAPADKPVERLGTPRPPVSTADVLKEWLGEEGFAQLTADHREKGRAGIRAIRVTGGRR